MNAALAHLERNLPLFHTLLTRRQRDSLALFAALNAAIAFLVFLGAILTADDLLTKAGTIIGGDFVVFRQAALSAWSSDPAAIYDMATLKATLQASYPGKGEFNLAWMYPPTMYLIVAPFALPPYVAAYAIWVILFGGLFALTLKLFAGDKVAFFFVMSSPAVFHAVITGQNGFMTATLMALAGYFAGSRPIVAGLAAALLTVKPQLGLLIPIAFIVGGHWRAFVVAAIGAALFALAATLVYGPEIWPAFLTSVSDHSARMDGGGFPFNKMLTPMAFLYQLGAPLAFARAVQICVALVAIIYVAIVWRRVDQPDLRYAMLATAALIATPYSFYYEFVVAAPAMLVIANRAVRDGWLPGEKLMMIGVWLAPMIPAGPVFPPSISGYPIAAFLAFALVARRALPAAGIRFASAARRQTAGS